MNSDVLFIPIKRAGPCWGSVLLKKRANVVIRAVLPKKRRSVLMGAVHAKNSRRKEIRVLIGVGFWRGSKSRKDWPESVSVSTVRQIGPMLHETLTKSAAA